MTTDLQRAVDDVWEVVRGLDLPLLLIEFEHYTITAATPSLFRDPGLTLSAVLGQPIFGLFDASDHDRSQLALRAIATGLIDTVRLLEELEVDHVPGYPQPIRTVVVGNGPSRIIPKWIFYSSRVWKARQKT